MEKFRNKYRIPSARAQWWDYGWNAAYFITICTAGRAHFFGKIIQGKMILSPAGVIADILWHEIPNHTRAIAVQLQHGCPMVELGEFVVMPNHVHGILILDKTPTDAPPVVETGHAPPVVETGHALSLQPSPGQKRFQNIGKTTVSSIIGSYKSAVTKHANRLGLKHAWQTRFHDHIIRDVVEYQRISDYIRNNPANWQGDKFYFPSSAR